MRSTSRETQRPFIGIVPIGCVSPGTLLGAAATQIPSATSSGGDYRHQPLGARHELLDDDDAGDERHPEQAHHAEREQHDHQPPAAADTERAVLDPHPKRARSSFAPAGDDEVQRAPAVAQAHRLQGRQLVQAGRRDRGTDDVRPRPVPAEEARTRGANAASEPVRGEAVHEPDREVAGDEHPRGHERLRSPRTFRRHAREQQHHRQRRRQHHRRHHRHPDAEVPAKATEVGAGARVHPAHPLHRHDPGDERAGQHDHRCRNGFAPVMDPRTRRLPSRRTVPSGRTPRLAGPQTSSRRRGRGRG